MNKKKNAQNLYANPIQQLNGDDPDRRVEFCEKLLAMAEEDSDIFDKSFGLMKLFSNLMNMSTDIAQFTGHPKIPALISKETLMCLVRQLG